MRTRVGLWIDHKKAARTWTRASVEDATKDHEAEGIPPGEIAERHFTLHTAEQVQQPVLPEEPTTGGNGLVLGVSFD